MTKYAKKGFICVTICYYERIPLGTTASMKMIRPVVIRSSISIVKVVRYRFSV